jgi:hypothetical protein
MTQFSPLPREPCGVAGPLPVVVPVPLAPRAEPPPDEPGAEPPPPPPDAAAVAIEAAEPGDTVVAEPAKPISAVCGSAGSEAAPLPVG